MKNLWTRAQLMLVMLIAIFSCNNWDDAGTILNDGGTSLAFNDDAGVHHKLGASNPGGQSFVPGGQAGATIVGGFGPTAAGQTNLYTPYPNAIFVDDNGNQGTSFLGPTWGFASTLNTPNQNFQLDGGGRYRVWCPTAGAWIGYATTVFTDGGTAWDGGPVALTPGYAYWDAGLVDAGYQGPVTCPTCWTDGGTWWDGGPVALTPGYAYWDGGWADAGIGAAAPALPLSANPEIWNLGAGPGSVILEIYSTASETCYFTNLQWALR